MTFTETGQAAKELGGPDDEFCFDELSLRSVMASNHKIRPLGQRLECR